MRDVDYTACGGCFMCLLLALVCLLLGFLCGMLITRHVADACTYVPIACTSVRDADYAACGGCLHLCVYGLDFCAGC